MFNTLGKSKRLTLSSLDKEHIELWVQVGESPSDNTSARAAWILSVLRPRRQGPSDSPPHTMISTSLGIVMTADVKISLGEE